MTQRGLSAGLGVALGLTNLLIRRLVAKGYVRMAGAGPRHVRYFMTAAGREALAGATRVSMENTVRLYTETRDVIRSGLCKVSARCQPDAHGRKSVVFYGAGDVAEIAYVSLQSTDLTLVGVVDDVRDNRFFGMPIHRPDVLTAGLLAGEPYSQVVVTSVRHTDRIRTSLESRAVPRTQISYLRVGMVQWGATGRPYRPVEDQE